jgi:hypothetical protein
MNADIKYILAMCCVLPAIAGIYRYKKIDSKYHPFIYMMVLTAVTETIIYLSIKFPAFRYFPSVTANIYMLANFSLFLYFVCINGYLSKKGMQLLFAVAAAVCLINYICLHTFLSAFYYLLCYVSACMLIISIDILSRQTMAIKYKLANNFWFWFSSFSIIYNAFTLLTFGLYVFAIDHTAKGKAIGAIQQVSNTVCYIFFIVAMLKIPEKK